MATTSAGNPLQFASVASDETLALNLRASATRDDAQSNAARTAILSILKERTGTDFSRYRAATITRRIVNRMIGVGATTFEQYLELLRDRDDETFSLLDRVTIKVSRFYRNAETFDLLREQVLPELARVRGRSPLRIWSAGCSHGEEAYSLAMLLDSADIDGVVYATDVDPVALQSAAQGCFFTTALTELPADLRERYCRTTDGDFIAMPKSLQTRIHFSRHDLTQHEAFSPDGDGHFDLICCRNVLIYFDREHQAAALARIRQAVRNDGYLCLGEAEWPLPPIASTLKPLTHKSRVFRALAY